MTGKKNGKRSTVEDTRECKFVAVHTPNVLSLCTGGGGLDLGIKLARPDFRTVCYVEREAFAVSVLVAAMEIGGLDQAPVWSDARTFDGRPWRGIVDCVIGGIPCQPWSYAGSRLGTADERDLWPDACRIIGEVGPGVVFLEEVSGFTWYFHERVGADLRGMGYRTAEGLFSAAEIGAPHERRRFFVLAYSDSGLQRIGRGGMEGDLLLEGGRHEGQFGLDSPSGELADASGPGRPEAEPLPRRRPSQSIPVLGDQELADADGCGRGTYDGDIRLRESDSSRTGPELADADGCGREQEGMGGTIPSGLQAGLCRQQLPDAEREGSQGLRWPWEAQPFTTVRGLFPPKPSSTDEWAYLLDQMPETEPAICRMADGMAGLVEPPALLGHRGPRLRLLGNGVVPLVAAYAFRALAARATRGRPKSEGKEK